MKHIELASGDQMPALGLGTWKMADGVGYTAVNTAIQAGYRHIDCAWIYENEEDVGRAINECLEQKVVSRDELWITSKLWNDRHREQHVIEGCKESLQKLQLDYLDLYLVHWPVAQKHGVARPSSAAEFSPLDEVPLIETWNAMQRCVDQGLCRNIGVSNFSQKKLQHLIDETGRAPACNQVESHPFLQQTSLFDYCQSQNIAFTAYSPLGSGDRPDGMKRQNEPNLFNDSTIQTLASELNSTPAQVILGWAIQRGTIPIPKSGDIERQKQNLAAADLQLSEDQMNQIGQLDQRYRFVDGTFWEMEGGPYTVAELWDE